VVLEAAQPRYKPAGQQQGRLATYLGRPASLCLDWQLGPRGRLPGLRSRPPSLLLPPTPRPLTCMQRNTRNTQSNGVHKHKMKQRVGRPPHWLITKIGEVNDPCKHLGNQSTSHKWQLLAARPSDLAARPSIRGLPACAATILPATDLDSDLEPWIFEVGASSGRPASGPGRPASYMAGRPATWLPGHRLTPLTDLNCL